MGGARVGKDRQEEKIRNERILMRGSNRRKQEIKDGLTAS